MALNAKEQPRAGGGDFVVQDALPENLYPARLVQVIGLGLQPQNPFQGQPKDPIDKIHLTYELSYEFVKDEEGVAQEDKPRWLSEDLPFHHITATKAKSNRRLLALDPTGLAEGDFTVLLGAACSVAVTKNVKKGAPDGQFVNYVGDVSGAVSAPGFVQPELVNAPAIFDPSEPDMEVYDTLPDWLQKKICSNLNFNGSKLQELLGIPAQAVAVEEEPAPAQASPPPAPVAPVAA